MSCIKMYAHSNALITDVATFYYFFFAHPLTHSRKELCNTRNEYHFFHTNSITVDTWLFSNITCVRVSESECAHNSLHQSANKLIPFVDAPLTNGILIERACSRFRENRKCQMEMVLLLLQWNFHETWWHGVCVYVYQAKAPSDPLYFFHRCFFHYH